VRRGFRRGNEKREMERNNRGPTSKGRGWEWEGKKKRKAERR